MEICSAADIKDFGFVPAWQQALLAAPRFLRRAAARNAERFSGVML